MNDQEDRLADTINEEPIVFMDCSSREIMLSLGTGAGIGLLSGSVIGLLVGPFLIWLCVGLALSVAIAWFLLVRFATIRHNKYSSYLAERVFITKRNLGLISSTYISGTKRFRRGRR